MPKPYSRDLRERVVRAVEAGASCHEAAAAFEVSPSSAVRWVARWRQSGSVAAKPMGGKRSPLDAHKAWLLDLIAAEPDLTLEEIRGRLRARGIAVSASSVWRFYDRHNITFKKCIARPVRKWFRHDNLSSLHQRIRSRGASPAKMEIRASRS